MSSGATCSIAQIARASVDGIFTADAFLGEVADLLSGPRRSGTSTCCRSLGRAAAASRWPYTVTTVMSRTCRSLSS